MNISVRDVNAEVFREFKAAVAMRGTKLGSAVSMALKHWLECRQATAGKKGSLLDLKSVDFGPGSEKWSSEIDETLYGGRLH
ncbi:hypothetical protein H0N96_02005 [Candidatus Micrarchaeota archaeon]|jgi:hypothetical protein|nr:hypothetical protein [Candidatus Micrarchaeota archaeon]